VTQVVRQAAAEQHWLSAAGLSEFEPAAASRMRARCPPEAAQSGAAVRAELPSLKRAVSRPDAEVPAEQAAESQQRAMKRTELQPEAELRDARASPVQALPFWSQPADAAQQRAVAAGQPAGWARPGD